MAQNETGKQRLTLTIINVIFGGICIGHISLPNAQEQHKSLPFIFVLGAKSFIIFLISLDTILIRMMDSYFITRGIRPQNVMWCIPVPAYEMLRIISQSIAMVQWPNCNWINPKITIHLQPPRNKLIRRPTFGVYPCTDSGCTTFGASASRQPVASSTRIRNLCTEIT